MERQAEAIFAHLDELGDGSMLEGALVGIEEGWYQGEIADAAYELERKLNDGPPHRRRRQRLPRGQRRAAARHPRRSAPRSRSSSCKRLAAVKADRDGEAVDRALARLRADAADPEVNLMPALLDAARAYATVGETMDALADVFGRYRETPVI